MPINGLQIATPSSVDKTGSISAATIGSNGRVTFTTCETLSLNGIFTSSYDNYLIVVRLKGSIANFPQFRLRNSGGDSASGYANQYIYARNTTASAARVTSDTSFQTIGNSATIYGGIHLYLYGPYIADRTAARSVNVDPRSDMTISDYAGTHSASTSYTGITLRTSTVPDGTMTGIITAYGFNN